MKVKTNKRIYIIKKKFLNGWYFCMKPLALLIEKYEKTKSKKRVSELENMSLEEVARLYVKYTVKAMVKRKDSKEKYYCCTKKDGYSDYYEDCFILADLSRFECSRFTGTKLNSWYCYSPDYKTIGYGDGNKKRWINLEDRLRKLAEKEFIRVGCKVEYIDESGSLDECFIKQSGYKKTMVVST